MNRGVERVGRKEGCLVGQGRVLSGISNEMTSGSIYHPATSAPRLALGGNDTVEQFSK